MPPPPLLRWVQQNAVAKWCARGMLENYRTLTARGATPGAACQRIIDVVAVSERKHTVKAYGKSHPEAQPVMHEASA